MTTGPQVRGWTYYEHIVSGLSNSLITISGNGNIDELRLYPKGALVTTYTYKPLVGMTSQTDASGKTMYYEYDAYGRLAIVRDQYQNIVKQYCYMYANSSDVTPCVGQTVYYNDEQSQGFYKNDCSNGTGSLVTYDVPMNTYSSTISKDDANNKALSDIAANGQAYANANGTCTIYAQITYENTFFAGDNVYGDVVVRFYADANGTQPIVVSNLTVNYEQDDQQYGTPYYMTATVSGTYAVLQSQTTLQYSQSTCDYNGNCLPYYYNIDYYLDGSSAYSIIP